MMTGAPVNDRPPGPARKSDVSATSSGSMKALDRVRARIPPRARARARSRARPPARRSGARRAACGRAGADRDGEIPVLGAFERQRADEPQHAVLGRHVRGLNGDAASAWADATTWKRPSPAAWRGPGVLCEQERARQQQRDQPVPHLLRELGHRRDVLDARVGDDDVEAAEALDRSGDGGPVALALAQVRGERRPWPVGIRVHVHREHVTTGVLEPPRHGAPDAAGSARDQRSARLPLHVAQRWPMPDPRSMRQSENLVLTRLRISTRDPRDFPSWLMDPAREADAGRIGAGATPRCASTRRRAADRVASTW